MRSRRRRIAGSRTAQFSTSAFPLTEPTALWVSAASVAQAVFQIDVDTGIVSGDKIWGESSLDNFATVLETVSAPIGAPDLSDFQIDDFAFSSFADGLTYVRFWVSNSADVAISPKSDTISETIAATAGPPTLTYVTTVDGVLSTPNTTAVNASVGAAFASRRVIVGVSARGVGARTISSATIGGVAATLHGSPQTQGTAEFVQYISAIVPTGTTATIDVVWSGSRTVGPDAFHIFTVDDDDLTSSTPTLAGASTAGATTLGNDINVSEGGFVILVATWNSGTTKTPIGSGETAITDVVYTQRYFMFYSGSNLSANAAWTGAVNWTGSFAGAMQMATWR